LTVFTTALTVVPGLSVNVTVPANSEVYISTDGGLAPLNVGPGDTAVVDVVLAVDNVIVPNGGVQRVIATNVLVTNGAANSILGFRYWSMAQSIALTAGPHTISVQAALAPQGGPAAFSSHAATVSGDSNSILQGQLNVIILNK
jgi:hypothetical protein